MYLYSEVLVAAMVLALLVCNQNIQGSPVVCKDPTVAHRLMTNDVRYASPFYVIALPRTPKTEQIDNVCYTYFETGGAFFHIISVVFKNGSNAYYTFHKSDIANREGLAQSTANKKMSCVYHDYTLIPICDATVFVLYRCFIEGTCNDIDIGITPNVDVRVVLAATTHISGTCRLETQANLKDTSYLDGGDYVILPQSRKPQCVTSYNNHTSINAQNALGSIVIIEEDLTERFGESNQDLVFTGSTVATSLQDDLSDPKQTSTDLNSSAESSSKPSETNVNINLPGSTTVLTSQSTSQYNYPKRTYADVVKTSTPMKLTPDVTSNVIYHVHSWSNLPPGCCKCN